jgi:hypothetical protein
MSRDTYKIHGQTGAVGPNTHAHDMTFQQIRNQSALDLARLAEELARLRAAMKEIEGKPKQAKAIGEVANGEKAASQGDDRTALRHLKTAGTWTLGVAEKIGVPLAVEAMKRMMEGEGGLPIAATPYPLLPMRPTLSGQGLNGAPSITAASVIDGAIFRAYVGER